MVRRNAALWLVLAAVAAFYAQVSTAFFCGYDDFTETNRAAFEDAAQPSRIFTTTHFGTSRYRPGNRIFTYLSWHWGGRDSKAFRFRNLVFHLLAVALVYGIALLLSRSRWAAAGAALLFGVHPMTNQVVVGAVFTDAEAYAMLLAAFFLFLASLEKDASWGWLLAGSFLCTALALLTYEPTIVVFGFIGAYFILAVIRGFHPPRKYVATLVGGSGLVLIAFIAVRRIFVHEPTPLVPLPIMIRNTIMYLGSLVLPVDSVFAHQYLGTPLPSELVISRSMLVLAFAAVVVIAAGLLLALSRPAVRTRFAEVDWPLVALLAIGIPVSLSPFLAFTGHPSETYQYLPAALYAILLSLILSRVIHSKAAYVSVIAVFAVLFAAGTWTRNSLVTACGATAQRIVTGLPLKQWATGEWNIRLSVPPSDPEIHRYGIYGWRGLATIDPGGDPSMPSAQSGLRSFSGNEHLRVQVVQPDEMRDCNQPDTCFWVSQNGDVRDASGPQP